MASRLLTGVVQEDGSILIRDAAGFRPGERVWLQVQPFEIPKSVTLEEAKRQLAEWDEQELTEEQIAAFKELDALFEAAAVDDSGLPEDHADEMDHYLYGTPKRSGGKEVDV